MAVVQKELQETTEKKGPKVNDLKDALHLLQGPKEIAKAASVNLIWSRLLAEKMGTWRVCVALFDIMVSRKPKERVVHEVPKKVAEKLLKEHLVGRHPTPMVMAYAINQKGVARLQELEDQAQARAQRRKAASKKRAGNKKKS